MLKRHIDNGARGHEIEYHAHDASQQGPHVGVADVQTEEVQSDIDDHGEQADDKGQPQIGRRVLHHGVPGASEDGTDREWCGRSAGNVVHIFLL